MQVIRSVTRRFRRLNIAQIVSGFIIGFILFGMSGGFIDAIEMIVFVLVVAMVIRVVSSLSRPVAVAAPPAS